MGNSASKTDKNLQSDDDFCRKYKLGAFIASGTFAKVRRCTRISDGEEFAVKIVKKKDCTSNELLLLRDEIDICSSIKHPHIINLEDVFINNHTVQMVLELCDNQTLSDMMYRASNQRLSQTQCAHILQIIASTLQYLHSQQIIHRDLKPENILFTKDFVLKITDFGSAFTKINRTDYKNRSFSNLSLLGMNTMIGTPNYVAPEILRGHKYSYRVDLWSLGVILFECIAGYHPFSTRKTRKSIGALYAAVMSGKYKMEAVWDNIDGEATDLMQKLVVVDPQQRITADQVLKHSFIMKHDGDNKFAQKPSINHQQPLLEEKEASNDMHEPTAIKCKKIKTYSAESENECVLYPIKKKSKSQSILEYTKHSTPTNVDYGGISYFGFFDLSGYPHQQSILRTL